MWQKIKNNITPRSLASKTELEPIHNKAIPLIKSLNGMIRFRQPNSLTYNYFYSYSIARRNLLTKDISYISQLLDHFFGSFYIIISKPVFLFSQNKLVIYINYYIPNPSKKLVRRHIWKYNQMPANTANKLSLELNQFIEHLSSILTLNVELELNQLKYPFHDSHILSKLIALNTNKRRFRSIINLIIRKALVISNDLKTDQKDENFFRVIVNNRGKGDIVRLHKTVPTVLTGLKVKIAGRLTTERVIPKRTIKRKEIGNFSKTSDSIVDYAMYTNKNKRGSYTVKVWTTSRICSPVKPKLKKKKKKRVFYK